MVEYPGRMSKCEISEANDIGEPASRRNVLGQHELIRKSSVANLWPM